MLTAYKLVHGWDLPLRVIARAPHPESSLHDFRLAAWTRATRIPDATRHTIDGPVADALAETEPGTLVLLGSVGRSTGAVLPLLRELVAPTEADCLVIIPPHGPAEPSGA